MPEDLDARVALDQFSVVLSERLLLMPFHVAIAAQLQGLLFLQYFIEASAVIASAFSGMLAARSKRMDLVGTYIVAFVTAFGGGTLRDLLLDHRPLFWVQFPQYAIVVFALSLVFVYAPWFFPTTQPFAKRLFDWVDALGLALFSLSGVSYGLGYELPYFAASLIGVITGVFGGVLRDILLIEIPMIFRTQTSLYATCSFVGCWIFLAILAAGISPTIASFVGFTAIVVLRVISIHYSLTLPIPNYLKDKQR